MDPVGRTPFKRPCRTAGGTLVLEAPRQPRWRGRPWRENAGQMVEGRDEALVAGIEQIRHEAVERAPRVDDRLTAHAVADVEEDSDADWRPFVGKLRNRLRIAVFEHVEVVFLQTGDQTTGVVGDGDGHFNGRDGAAKGLRRDEGHKDGLATKDTKTTKDCHGSNVRPTQENHSVLCELCG